MAITTVDGIVAGLKPPEIFQKVGAGMEAAGVWHTMWYTAGAPGAAAANSAGVNGRAVDPSLVTGEIARTNPGAGNAYLAKLIAASTQVGTLMLVDRLWENSGLSVTSTSAQGITPATLPARDRDGTTNGMGVLAMMEWSAAGGSSSGTVTLTYTDEAGNAGATGAFVPNSTPSAGTCEFFPLAAGDYGVRAPTSYIASATRTSGTHHLVLVRPLLIIGVPAPNVAVSVDAIQAGLPRIYNDSVLQLLWLANSTTATTISGQYVEAQG